MPRNVRNFWLEADIDGRSSKFAGGPGSASGGMQIRLYYREKGQVSGPIRLNCWTDGKSVFIDIEGKKGPQKLGPGGAVVRFVEAER